MSIKLHAMMGVSALAATAALGGVAQAQTIYGGGSSLVAPYHRQVADCYGVDRPLYARGTPPTPINTSAPYTPFIQPFTGCPTALSTANTVDYLSTGSGTGIAAVYSNDALRYGDVDPAAGTQNFPSVQYGLSETALSNADVTTYNSGGVIQGVTLTATPSGANQYAIPQPLYGALVQIPVAVAPVALAYDPAYSKTTDAAGNVTANYRFNVNSAFARSNGGLRLSQTTYCKILNGQITNWNDPAITADNGGLSLKDPADPAAFSLAIELVGRSDSSGTTQVTSRHLAAACASLSGNAFTATAGTSTLPPTLIGNPAGGAPVSGKYTVASGTNGVAAYVGANPPVSTTAVQGRLGYLGADYTLPNAANNSLPYALFTADLQNGAGGYRAPTAANATAAFNANRPPETATGASGNYDPAVTTWGVRTNPADWTRVGTLANPTPATAYPIVGTVNWIGYTCYKPANVDVVRSAAGASASATGYLNYWFDDAIVDGSTGILAQAGLAALPAAWQNAIKNTFLTPIATGTNPTAPLNLGIASTGTGATGTAGVTNSTCSAKTGA